MNVQDASRAASLRALNCGMSDADARAAMVSIGGVHVYDYYMDRIIKESLQHSCIVAGQSPSMRDLVASMVECVLTDRPRRGPADRVNAAVEVVLARAIPLMQEFVAEVVAVHLNIPVEWAAAHVMSQAAG